MRPNTTTVAVAVCTYNRHASLAVLLEALVVNARTLADRAAVGVAIVDDSPEGNAREVVERFVAKFELGLCYRISGRKNISVARNLAVDAAADMADWVAMTDDDCEPVGGWLENLLTAQRQTGADAVTGPYRRRVPPGSPSWLVDEPFLDFAVEKNGTAQTQPLAGTNNSMISASWWRTHPDVRFKTDLGVTGGEDMVFYRTAVALGLRVGYAEKAVVFENEPASRLSLRYQLWQFLWLGNSSFVTRLQTGEARPFRMFLQGGNTLRRALTRPIRRLLGGQRPQLRYSLAMSLNGLGEMLGVLGVRLRHH